MPLRRPFRLVNRTERLGSEAGRAIVEGRDRRREHCINGSVRQEPRLRQTERGMPLQHIFLAVEQGTRWKPGQALRHARQHHVVIGDQQLVSGLEGPERARPRAIMGQQLVVVRSTCIDDRCVRRSQQRRPRFRQTRIVVIDLATALRCQRPEKRHNDTALFPQGLGKLLDAAVREYRGQRGAQVKGTHQGTCPGASRCSLIAAIAAVSSASSGASPMALKTMLVTVSI